MRQFQHLVVGSIVASGAVAAPFNVNASACAQVSASVATQTVPTPTVPAQLAYDCITSVPLNTSAALALLDAVRPYLLWQSTTDYIKNPPAEYAAKVQDPVDVWGGFEKIKSNLQSGAWTQEFEFGWALYRLLQTTHDGHFTYIPDSIGKIFNWGRPVPLVSVSDDGTSLPVPYVYPDVLAASLGNTSFTPSPIVTINGKNATAYLEEFSQYGSLQDRDALYNNVFYELAIVSLGSSSTGMGTFTGGGRGRWVYPGAETTFTFANGSTKTYENFARVITNFTGINSGEDLYRLKFATPANLGPPLNAPSPAPTNSATSSPTVSSAAIAAATTPAPGYPSPVIRQVNNFIGGYYLEGEGFNDVAVLNAASFVGLSGAQEQFQQTGKQFLATAKAAGKTKLIIDLSANGGGTILLGYDLFKQLFPTTDPYSAADRFRAFESTDLVGQVYSEIAEPLPRVLDPANETLLNLEYDVISSVFNYQTDFDVNAKNFPNWPAKYGPHPNKNDNYSSLIRWNLSDVLTPYNSGGIYVTGYEPNKTAPTEPPFSPENIVVMTDGYCASTCTIFSELMRQLGGVKYILMGGRSRPDIGQAVGGVKGTNNFGWSDVQYQVRAAFDYSSPEKADELNKTELSLYSNNLPFYRWAYSGASSINFRDGIRKGDESQTPLHFVYEEADCRIFWTAAMTVDITAAWKAVADSTWNGKNHCIAGSSASGSNDTPRRDAPARPHQAQLSKRSSKMSDYPLDLWSDATPRLDRTGVMPL